MKRISRKMSDTVKNKIRQKMLGKNKTEQHKEKISQALKKYWENIPINNKDNENENNTTK